MKLKLSRINDLLLVCIVLVNGYVIVTPFVPAVIFHFESHTARHQQLSAELQQKKPITKSELPGVDQSNSVVIPSMLLNQPILEAPVTDTYTVLAQGIWRWPLGSTPNKGGNTILIGHRFTYTNPRGVFYELNQVQVGDQIGVFWNSKEYLYTVASTSVVEPSDTTILGQTAQPELTLYTCTPTWNPSQRLIVTADLTSTKTVESS